MFNLKISSVLFCQFKKIVRSFANNKQERRYKKVKTKQYTEEQEQMARFAKAMGHPARMAILVS